MAHRARSQIHWPRGRMEGPEIGERGRWVAWKTHSGKTYFPSIIPQTATFYTCDVCGGNTWKPTLPIPHLIVSVLFVLFLFFMGFYAVIELDDMEGLIMFPFGLYA